MKPEFDGKRFSFADGPGLASPKDVLRWMVTRKAARWPPHLTNPPADPVIERIHGTALRITYINHATVLIQGDGVNLITDPVFSRRVGPVSFAGPRRHRPPGLSVDELPPIDAVLISHTHYDHLDIPSLRQLQDRHRPVFLSPLKTDHILKKGNVTDAVEMNWWDEHRLNPACTITMVPAMHWTSRRLGDQNTSLWGGYVISIKSGAVYFAGDTGYAGGEHFRQARQRLGPFRCALLPIGAYEPRWFMQPQHMNPAEAVQACDDLQARHALGIHHGTFQLTDEAHDAPVSDLQQALECSGVSSDVFRTLNNGGAWDLPV